MTDEAGVRGSNAPTAGEVLEPDWSGRLDGEVLV